MLKSGRDYSYNKNNNRNFTSQVPILRNEAGKFDALSLSIPEEVVALCSFLA